MHHAASLRRSQLARESLRWGNVDQLRHGGYYADHTYVSSGYLQCPRQLAFPSPSFPPPTHTIELAITPPRAPATADPNGDS